MAVERAPWFLGTSPIASAEPGSVTAIQNPKLAETRASGRASAEDGRKPSMIVRVLADAGLLLLVIFAVPLAILVLGTPIALFVRLLIEIVERM